MKKFIVLLFVVLIAGSAFGQSQRVNRYNLTARKGLWSIEAALPVYNMFSQSPDVVSKAVGNANLPIISDGMFGISLGASYFYTDKHSLTLSWTNMGDKSNSFDDPKESFSDNVLNAFSVYDSYHLNRFSFGYGLSAVNRKFTYSYVKKSTTNEFGEQNLDERNWYAGLMLNAYWRATPFMKVGVAYRPTFVGGDAGYQHSISFELRFNIALSKDAYCK